MQTLDEMISQQMLNPDKYPIAVSEKKTAVLHLRHSLDGLKDGLSLLLEKAFIFNAAGILLLENTSLALFRDPLGLKAAFNSKSDALEAGLALQKLSLSQGMATTIALGWGQTIPLPNNEWLGADSLRAKRLAGLANPLGLTITKSFASHLLPPEGVGVFEANREQAKRIGHPYWVVRDYR